jgi:hypothetical protein
MQETEIQYARQLFEARGTKLIIAIVMCLAVNVPSAMAQAVTMGHPSLLKTISFIWTGGDLPDDVEAKDGRLSVRVANSSHPAVIESDDLHRDNDRVVGNNRALEFDAVTGETCVVMIIDKTDGPPYLLQTIDLNLVGTIPQTYLGKYSEMVAIQIGADGLCTGHGANENGKIVPTLPLKCGRNSLSFYMWNGDHTWRRQLDAIEYIHTNFCPASQMPVPRPRTIKPY